MSELNEKLLEIKRQKDTYIIPENIKKDITIYGVTGTLEPGSSGSGDVKLFDTIEHMQADPNPSEGDLAVVYSDVYTPCEKNEYYFDGVWFPQTVVLPSVVTETYTDGNAFMGLWTLTPTTMTLTSRGFLAVNISYTSEDGQTYIRTDTTEMPCRDIRPLSSSANDLFTYFCTIREVTFTGFYKYNGTNYEFADTQLTLNNENQMLPNTIAYGKTGIIIGSENIYDNLNSALFFKHKASSDSAFTGVSIPSATLSTDNWFKSIELVSNGEDLLQETIKQIYPEEYFSMSGHELWGAYYDSEDNILYMITRITSKDWVPDEYLFINLWIWDITNQTFEKITGSTVPTNASATLDYGKIQLSSDKRYIYYHAIEFSNNSSYHYHQYYDNVFRFDLVNKTSSIYKSFYASGWSTIEMYNRPNIINVDNNTFIYADYAGIYKITTSNSTPQKLMTLTKRRCISYR